MEEKEEVKEEIKTNPLNPIERAEAINLKLEENIKKQEELLRRNEEATAKLILGGRSYAGQETKGAETFDEKWAREAKERYAGTGMDPT